MIRLITFRLAGEGYLNFMGNEFGHPEWIDFPREGNNYATSTPAGSGRWPTTPTCATRACSEFDAAMQQLDSELQPAAPTRSSSSCTVHEDNKQLIYRRGPLVFAFNFHPTNRYSDLRIPVPDPIDYQMILNTDAKAVRRPRVGRREPAFRLATGADARTEAEHSGLRPQRSAIVLAPTNRL